MKVRAPVPLFFVWWWKRKRKRKREPTANDKTLLGWFAEWFVTQVLREIELEATGDWGQGSKKRGAWDEDASSAFDWDEDDTAATSSGGEEHDAGRAFSSSSEDVGRFALGHDAFEQAPPSDLPSVRTTSMSALYS
ncbi:uncharacterized protein ACA1_271260 [Acanthamoeba castellanii str. Neff]|uniref:Uncharacterized protein n=1 Tax=Acanthamoeba castellanii (strain ATCC 30010 / Neff) TaxID=1257118 RepID=L8GR53_ACACF|nr:uncharacterized protein ACA1_271260 [Acanthamoeba castellanii str. Neff]ELR14591.1 hypothetical protein ACA1_271260 [Acanthamoeba castellanii str. Neff]